LQEERPDWHKLSALNAIATFILSSDADTYLHPIGTLDSPDRDRCRSWAKKRFSFVLLFTVTVFAQARVSSPNLQR
jgi:hypothetical protein